MRSAVDSLIEAARLAPSGDNTQPWDFLVDRTENRITVRSNLSRDPSPMNAGDRMSRIAMGAALENMLQTASANDWAHAVEVDQSSVSVRLSEAYEAAELQPALRDRVSNRRKYLSEELPHGTVAALASSVSGEGPCIAHWITDAAERSRLCGLIGVADSLMLSNERIRKAFLDKVRFDQPIATEVDEGLSLGSLELSASERMGLRMMRWMPNVLLQIGGVKRTLRSTALKLAGSACGFCVITSSDHSATSDYDVGRVFQRSWLELTRRGCAVQPMMSLLVLRNIRDNGSAELSQQIGLQRIDELLSSFASVIATAPDSTPCAMLRFGKAPSPTSRTGRLSIDTLTTTTS